MFQKSALFLGCCSTVFACVPILAKAQQSKADIQGVVTNEAGKAIAFVNVAATNSQSQTFHATTDSVGRFKLAALPSPGRYRIVLTNVGYKEKIIDAFDVKTTGINNIVVTMVPNNIQMEEIVVVGYGTQRKSDVTGAISSVGANLLKDQPVVSLESALQGKTPGVQITQNSGSPGATAQVRIRGLTSINNSDPLYVIDGIPLASNDINIIDPSNIESIDILKDSLCTSYIRITWGKWCGFG
jgi:Outer membrane receptor proteins, mostly Fe transport